MKKLAILCLAVMYLTITSGVMVNVHYCMGEIAQVNYGHDDSEDCGNCGMDSSPDCCHTEHQFVKSHQDHLLAKTFPHAALQPAIVPTVVQYVAPVSYHPQKRFAHYHAPPDKRMNELNLYNSVFRI